MALTVQKTLREFMYNGVKLGDPNPGASVDTVRSIHAATHPEIETAAIDGPKIKGNVQTYIFVKSVGTKG